MTGAKFTTGSTMRHVVVMTATGGVGLISLFLVDALNLFYISLLGQQEMAAAIGFAGTVQFFMISMAIGLSIAATAVVSRTIGAGDHEGARRLAASSLTVLVAVVSVAAALTWLGRDFALELLGAEGGTKVIASRFLSITLPSVPVLGIGMVAGGFLRAAGDARRAMFITLTGGAVAAVLDPILIFGLEMGVDGAAFASATTRVVFAVVGLYLSTRAHDLIGRIDLSATIRDARQILAIGLPAVATQLSTPFGNAFLTGVIATHGDTAVAGWAVVGRLSPLAFGVIFSLSGAVGPILGQNRGAGLYDRIRATYRDALIFVGIYVMAAWFLLWLATDAIISGFGLVGPGAEVLTVFTHVGAGAYLFAGALFVSNAAFNNLGRPMWSTLFNWSRDAVAIPLLVFAIGSVAGAAGASGVILVQALAGLCVGLVAAITAWRYVGHLARKVPKPGIAIVAQPAFASGRAAVVMPLVTEELPSELPSPLAEDEKSR
jgi:putative MATE family efflux protein